MDEVAFYANYDDWSCGRKLQVTEATTPEEVVLALAGIRSEAARRAFSLLKVDTARLAAKAEEAAKGRSGYAGVAQALSQVKGSEVKALAGSLVPEERLLPFAEASFNKSLLSFLRLNFEPSETLVSQVFPRAEARAGPAGPASGGKAVVFAAKYGDWISIKKMSVDEKTAPQEIAAMLAGIRETVDRKVFQLAKIGTEKIEERAAALAKGRRKAYGSLAEIFSSLDEGETKSFLFLAVPEARLLPLAEACLFRSIFSATGFQTEVSIEALKKAFPELKVAMPKGRLAGAKKKK